MSEAVCIKSEVVKEEISQNYPVDCKFPDPCKIEIDIIQDVRDTREYVKCENDAQYDPHKTVSSCSVMKDERHTQIKDEYSCYPENGEFQIATKVDKVDIKSEEIDDVKHEPVEDTRLSSTENGVTCNNCDEFTEPIDMLKPEDLDLVDGKTIESSFEMSYKDNTLADLHFLEKAKHKCNSCPYKTRWKKDLQRHMLAHADSSNIPMYQCNACPYKTRRKGNLQNHILIHTDSPKARYECNICPYKTWWKSHLRRHMLVHPDSSQATYKCDICQHETRRRDSLQRHTLVVHTNPKRKKKRRNMAEAVCIKSDAVKEEMREEYPVNCKFRDSFKNEVDVIQDAVGTPDYVKCETVDVQYDPLKTMSSCSVVKDERHTQVKDEYSCYPENGAFQIATKDEDEVDSIVEDIKSEEIDIVEDTRLSPTQNGVTCNNCDEVTEPIDMLKPEDLDLVDGETIESSFEMLYKDNMSVDLHRLEKPEHECHSCPYKTRCKKDLERHMLVHADSSHIPMYECNNCPYKTRRKGNLQNHMLVHMDPSKTKIFACSICPYKTARKANLQNHVLIHTDSPRIGRYQCNICPYKTWWKSHLRRHMLVHPDSSEVMYKCGICQHETRRKDSLQRHMLLIHTNPKRKKIKVRCIHGSVT